MVILPYLVGGAVFAGIVTLVLTTNFDFGAYYERFTARVEREIARADMEISPSGYALTIAGASVVAWLVLLAFVRPSAGVAIASLPLAASIAVLGGVFNLRLRSYLRLKNMQEQLEQVFRMLSGALRVGVGLRQSLIMVADELPDPARREFRRVIGRCNIGIPMIDAIDEMAKTIPGSEMQMFARVIRVQQQTGGDLAMILETLAATIRDRRRVKRKIGSLTAQGRFGAAIIGGLPVLVGGFVILTQGSMSHALLHTTPGLGMLGAVALLEGAGIFTLLKILQLDV
ncbi:MAG: type II secretion system F family protein [Vulcanimicrobiaceae bacterium]